MEPDACKQCRGTGLVSLSTGPEPIAGFSSACSCNAGNAIWDAVLDLITDVETQTKQLRIEEPIGKYAPCSNTKRARRVRNDHHNICRCLANPG
jgi:hypothetical protein